MRFTAVMCNTYGMPVHQRMQRQLENMIKKKMQKHKQIQYGEAKKR